MSRGVAEPHFGGVDCDGRRVPAVCAGYCCIGRDPLAEVEADMCLEEAEVLVTHIPLGLGIHISGLLRPEPHDVPQASQLR